MANRSAKRHPPIWEGVFSRMPPECGRRAFGSNVWFRKIHAMAIQQRRASGLQGQSLLVHWLAAFSLGPRVRILDVGGGLAGEWWSAQGALRGRKKMEYWILETPEVCRYAEKHPERGLKVRHIYELAQGPRTYDLVWISQTLQYFEDWKGLLNSLAAKRPRSLLIHGLLGGVQPRFASLQNFYGSKIPVWFFNVKELVQTLSRLGYDLRMDSGVPSEYFDKIQPPPMKNFPPRLRIRNKRFLAFARRS